MQTSLRTDLRNVAIIAHVDHGKTTLVDHLLRQAHVFRANQAVQDLVMDSNQLERERGMTILAKHTGLVWSGTRINIIDTPGHADFSGEVERVINMADGFLLLIDAAEGPMPQTRNLLKRALGSGLKAIVVINKCDRPDARILEVVSETQDLFLELATDAEQLEFPILYAVGREGRAGLSPEAIAPNLEPLFTAIVDYIPPPRVSEEGPLRLLVTNLDYDDHLGTIAVGRVAQGAVRVGEAVAVPQTVGAPTRHQITALFGFEGLKRVPTERAYAGDVIAMAGVSPVRIGQTIASAQDPEALPALDIVEPTLRMTFGVNSSPMAGREGKHVTSRQLRARLWKELETNVGLRVAETEAADVFLVAGRGELHLSILIETLRREGYELEVSSPEAVTHIEGGVEVEPVEWLSITTQKEYVGTVTEQVGSRLGQLQNVTPDQQGGIHLEYLIPTRGLIGLRNSLLTATRGNVVLASSLDGYQPVSGELKNQRAGALVAFEDGVATTYGLNNAQERGSTYIVPGTEVYAGMIVGQHSRDSDIMMNVCKEKKLTNMRASNADIGIRLSPPVHLSLEQMIDLLGPDDLLEATPASLRLRKRPVAVRESSRVGAR